MNGLSLRISTIKASENTKKNAEIRMDLFQVPSSLILNPDNNKYISDLVDATTVDDQIKIIKEYSAYITDMQETLLSNIQILSKLFMEAPLKHAVRNTIVKYLSQITIGRELVVLGLTTTIKNKIKQYDGNQTNALSERNAIINSIGSCFDNFKVGTEAVHNCLHEILCFFNKSLLLYMEQLSHNISPSDKNEISLYIHNTIRVAISCFNHYASILRNTYEGEKNVEKVVLICWDLLENPEIPMDTKINCGILILMNANLERRYLRITERILTEENSTKKLCLLNGIICTIETDFFCKPDFKGFHIFSQAAYMLKEISEENSIEPSIILGVTRSLSQMTKRIMSLKMDDYLKSDRRDLIESLAINLGYSLSHLDHYMDSVRHLCRDLLKLTIQLGMKVNEKLNHIIFDYIRNIDINIATKCILISSICSIVKAKAVLNAVPNVNEYLLKSLTVNDHANMNLHINNCYETLMMCYGYEDNKQEWFDMWVKPILAEIIRNENCPDIKQTLFELIRKAIKLYPETAIYMIDCKTTVNFGLTLSALSIAKKSGLFDKIESNDKKWKNLITYEDIKIAMVSADDSTRMSALQLLTECHKSTELFTKEDLECVLFFLEININVQASSIRQKITGHMRNALNRLKSGFLSIIKKSDTDGKSHYYYDFVKRLHHFCIHNLFTGSNYSRRTISFQVLIQLLQIASYIFYNDENSSMWSEQQVHYLINALNDSYEANKIHCMTVLRYCPKFYFEKCNHLINYEITKALMTSIKPNDTLSAAYYLEYLCFVNTNLEVPTKSTESTTIVQNKVFKTLTWCEEILQHGLRIAKVSLLRAARENPMFGPLACIRHLLNKLDLKEITKCAHWVKFIYNLMNTCRELTQIVSIVVNNSSPEGHLPNDFSPIENFDINDDVEMQCIGSFVSESIITGVGSISTDEESESSFKTTPQMVLLCSWRTIKEVSLILGDIAFKVPIVTNQHISMINGSVSEDCSTMMNCDKILEIGSHFIQLLAETKHRGAFEQAYIGFSKLCIRLWGSQHVELHQMPMKWLQEILHVITNEEIDDSNSTTDDCDNSDNGLKTVKICSTRRSAGIPYMMQALITSELQVNSSKGLQFGMKKLLELCRTGMKTQTRTHSLNILRALFRCTDLGDSIGEFISEGIECAINGYDAESWSERNSSTLLFSALMIRIFGVQRTRDSENLNIRNKMTGRIFFLRYPQLYDYFIVELEKASQTIVKGARSKKLHPLLLLLSRLYPSALEGSESNLKLSRFVPIVSICSGCAELQTRHLAAKFIAIIVSPDLVFDRIFLLLESLNRSNNKIINSNSLHGALLQILYLIKTRTLGTMPQSSNELNNWIELYTAISNYLFEVKPNFILYGAIIDILIEILARCQSVIFAEDDQFLDDLNNIVDYLFNQSKQRAFYGSEQIMRKIVLIKLVMYVYNDDENTPKECFLCDVDPSKYSYDYLESIMNIIMLMLQYDETAADLELFELDKMELFYVRYLKKCKQDKVDALCNEFVKSVGFHEYLRSIAERNIQNSCTVKAYTILSCSIAGIQRLLQNSDCDANLLQQLFELISKNPEHLRPSIYKCVKRIYHTVSKNSARIPQMDALSNMASAVHCHRIRKTTVDILGIVSKYFHECESFDFLLSFSTALLILLRDDDSNIRNNTARIVINLLNQMKEKNNPPIISSYAQKVYLAMLSKTMIRCKFSMHQLLAMHYILMANQVTTELNSSYCADSEIRVFDRNEVNIYGETMLLKEYLITEIRSVLLNHNMNIDVSAEEVISIAQKYVHAEKALQTCLRDVQTPTKLVCIATGISIF